MKDRLLVEGTSTTPLVQFNSANGYLEFKGRLLPLDCQAFFDPILNWLDDYLCKPEPKTTLVIHLVYMNTRASKYLFQMLKKIKENLDQKQELTIKWLYDKGDEDMLEAGEDIMFLLDAHFEFAEVCNIKD